MARTHSRTHKHIHTRTIIKSAHGRETTHGKCDFCRVVRKNFFNGLPKYRRRNELNKNIQTRLLTFFFRNIFFFLFINFCVYVFLNKTNKIIIQYNTFSSCSRNAKKKTIYEMIGRISILSPKRTFDSYYNYYIK